MAAEKVIVGGRLPVTVLGRPLACCRCADGGRGSEVPTDVGRVAGPGVRCGGGVSQLGDVLAQRLKVRDLAVELVDAIPQEPSGKYRFCISKVARERLEELSV